MSKEEINFSWVQTHKELVKYLATKQNDQKGLIELLDSVGITGLHDEAQEGKRIRLEEIDPFSFLCYIYKYGPAKRLSFLQQISKKLKLSIPDDDTGIPSANPLKVCLFPFKFSRTNDEINRLWGLFFSALDGKIDDAQFADVISIKSTGLTKLTEALFDIMPEKYFPINGPSKPYLQEVFGLNPKFKTYSEYLTILDKIGEKTDKPLYELSYDAWLWNDQQKPDYQQKLIAKYKKLIKDDGNIGELYKWQAIKEFQGKWDIEAEDFPAMLKSIDFHNLIHFNTQGFLNDCVNYPEESRELFSLLFDESIDLKSRIEKFQVDANDLYKNLRPGLKSQQDERSIATYLTFRYPEKYSFYKSSFYTKYTNALKIKRPKVNEKYIHYLTLVDDLVDNYISKDQELIDLFSDT